MRHLCSKNLFFLSENHFIYEIMWRNMVKSDRTQITVLRMPIACSTPEATDTHSECVILIALLLQRWFCMNAPLCHIIISSPALSTELAS